MRNRASTPLKKAIVRQSWSKYNLYNLSRVLSPATRNRNFFQQKWTAKSLLRAYHGEPVRESLWTKMFRHRLKGVVPMNPQYLALNDGRNESAGRGSGLKQDNGSAGKGSGSRKDNDAAGKPSGSRKDKKSSRQDGEEETPQRTVEQTPYMQMTFAPLERRLDTAIFRALFASSTRQARQFVVHGAVKVNGVKMRYPGYLLNPGDLFQVDPERVMFATGAPKVSLKATAAKEDSEGQEDEGVTEQAEAEPELEAEEEDVDIEDTRSHREILKDLQSQAKSILASERSQIGAKRKQDLRAFTKSVKRMLSRSSTSTILTDSLEAQFEELKNQLRIQRQNKKEGKTTSPSEQKTTASKDTITESPDKPLADAQIDEEEATEEDFDEEINHLSHTELEELKLALQTSMDNPIDPSKPYATPWRPRDYMSAFTFIPRYLEVNQNICAAVYLRHPVARPGLGEVPTPFNTDVGAAAYVWYLRRR